MKGIAEAFDVCAEDYDRWFDSPQGKVLFEMEVEAVRLLMKDLEKPFLEIGVGTGRFAKKLKIDLGIDPSSKVLEMARTRKIKVKKARGEKLPFKDKTFGAVFLLFTLCFVEDPEKVLSETRRVLKRDGGLIIGIINRESPWGQLYMKKKTGNHPIYKYARFYSIKDAVKMIAKTGMSVHEYSSTLCQPPSETPYNEAAHKGLADGAGFVCILARKVNS